MLQIIFAYFSKCVHCVFLHKCKQFAKASVTNNLDDASFSGFFFDRSEYWWVRIYFRISVAFAFSSYSHYYANFFLSVKKRDTEKRRAKRKIILSDTYMQITYSAAPFFAPFLYAFLLSFEAVVRVFIEKKPIHFLDRWRFLPWFFTEKKVLTLYIWATNGG